MLRAWDVCGLLTNTFPGHIYLASDTHTDCPLFEPVWGLSLFLYLLPILAAAIGNVALTAKPLSNSSNVMYYKNN